MSTLTHLCECRAVRGSLTLSTVGGSTSLRWRTIIHQGLHSTLSVTLLSPSKLEANIRRSCVAVTRQLLYMCQYASGHLLPASRVYSPRREFRSPRPRSTTVILKESAGCTSMPVESDALYAVGFILVFGACVATVWLSSSQSSLKVRSVSPTLF